MENDYVLRKEHDEFARRIDEENKRQNHRLQLLEDNVRQINDLTVSVSRMAVNMENMLTAIERQGTLIEKQGERLETLEKEPGESYKNIKKTVITAAISTVVGGIITALIVLL